MRGKVKGTAGRNPLLGGAHSPPAPSREVTNGQVWVLSATWTIWMVEPGNRQTRVSL